MGNKVCRRDFLRRDFLKTAQAASLLAYAAKSPTAAAAVSKKKAPEPALSGTYTPVPDYPIQSKRYSEVKLNDAFWKPKVVTNAEVTIPFEVRKLTEPGSRRGL